MKNSIKLNLCVLLVVICALLAGCSNVNEPADLWQNAVYTSDTVLGEGSKTVNVSVEAGEKTVCFTISTDKATVGDALKEHNLISGEEGPYGLYVKKVNGITADYNIDQSYWSFNKNGEYMSTGVDITEFSNGDSFELVYTK